MCGCINELNWNKHRNYIATDIFCGVYYILYFWVACAYHYNIKCTILVVTIAATTKTGFKTVSHLLKDCVCRKSCIKLAATNEKQKI